MLQSIDSTACGRARPPSAPQPRGCGAPSRIAVHPQAMPALDRHRGLHGIRRYALPLAILILSLVGVACWSYSLQLQRDTLIAEKLARQEAEFSLKLAGR